MEVNEKKDRSFYNDPLSQSYYEGIERIIGTKKNCVTSFHVPQDVIEERKKFWSSFFDKYSEELSDDIVWDVNDGTVKCKNEIDPDSPSKPRVPMRKPASLIQYWVNTGNTPYKALIEAKEHSDSGSSLSEREPSNSPDKCAVPNNVTRTKENKCNDNSSCSSVDTAAYILSNTNVTKKAETMAIVEGAKESYDTKLQVVTNDNAQTVLTNANKLVEGDNENVVFDGNGNKYQDCYYTKTVEPAEKKDVAQDENVQPERSTKKIPEVLDMSAALDALSKIINLECNRMSQSNNNSPARLDAVDRTLASFIENDDSNDSEVEQNLMAVEANRDRVSSVDSNVTSLGNTMKSGNRKKLYSSRDSPVDLMFIRPSESSRISILGHNLHPALDPTLVTHKKKNMNGKKRKRRPHFFYASSDSENNIDNHSATSCTDGEEINQNPVENCLNSNEVLLKTSDNIANVHKDATHEKQQNVDNSLQDGISNSSLKSAKNGYIETPVKKISRVARKNTGKRSSMTSKKSAVVNLSPVICLTRISEKDIQRYKKSPNSNEHKNLNPVVRLTRMSESQIKMYKQRRIRRATGLIRQNNSFQHNISKRGRSRSYIGNSSLESRNSRGSKQFVFSCEVQNVDSEDINSDLSTVLICECKNGGVHDHCSISDTSGLTENSSQDILYCAAMKNKCQNSFSRPDISRRSTGILNSSALFAQLQQTKNKTDKREAVQERTHNTSLHKVSPEVLEQVTSSEPLVVLKRLPQRSIDNFTIGSPSKDKTQKSSEASEPDESPMLNTSRKDVSSRPTVTPARSKKSARNLCFMTSELANTSTSTTCSHLSDVSETMCSAKRNNTRNRSPFILLSSDGEDDFINLLQHSWPKKKTKLIPVQGTPRSGRSSTLRETEINDTEEISVVSEISSRAATRGTTLNHNSKLSTKSPRCTRTFSTLLQSSSENESLMEITERRKSKKYNFNNRKTVVQRIRNLRNKTKDRLNLRINTSEEEDASSTNAVKVKTPSPTKQNSSLQKELQSSTKKCLVAVERLKTDNGSKSKKSKSNVSRLRFQTRLFDSDIESMSLSSSHSVTSEK